ncbi:SAM hydrolase/SAM-dependent halogenase family protein [Halorubrum yunnanense]|uniref:S-adenosyl-l-methionine hydroxide adenosyltransferase family protein n=1 Tax=Halorubrum yunnanense TaxID=1526162 RepID=A0ABD5YD75_9EURY|nr:SAM-dependent chlorinase/fluorinase [Halorubrum yunnanense]
MITLTSDFGSPYPAAMKGAIRRQTDAEMIDVAHDLPRGDPRAAAFWLRFVLPEFPPAVHCAVVDPGVGTDRDALVVRAGAHVLVAPDNGLAMPPARALAEGEGETEESIEAFAVDVDEPASRTFHGRDVFAPVAARIRAALDDGPAAAGPEGVAAALAAMDDLSPATDPVDIAFPEPTVERDADGDPVAVDGEVLVIDRFGNVVTNVPGELVRGSDWIRVNEELTPVAETFGAVDAGDRLVTVGSHGYVECDVNDGRGDGAFDLRPGDEVRLVGDNVSM